MRPHHDCALNAHPQAGESHKDYIKREFSALKPFVIISLSYLLFTTTDGGVSVWVWRRGIVAWQREQRITCMLDQRRLC